MSHKLGVSSEALCQSLQPQDSSSRVRGDESIKKSNLLSRKFRAVVDSIFKMSNNFLWWFYELFDI